MQLDRESGSANWLARAGRHAVSGAGFALAALLASGPALAAKGSFSLFGQEVDAVSNTTLIGGFGVRVEPQDPTLIGKGVLDPNVCGRSATGQLYYQSCQGLFRTQVFPAQKLVNSPGYASSNFDQGDVNYRQGDLTQAPFRWGQDITLTFGKFTFFAKTLAFYDPLNNNFTEYHPNIITRQNYQQVGYISTAGSELIRAGNLPQALTVLSPLLGTAATVLNLPPNIATQLLASPLSIPTLGARTDSTPCPANRNPSGQPCGIVYGPGGVVYSKRRDAQTLHEIGLGIQLLDINLAGEIPLSEEHKVLVKVGRQQINWGEATIEFLDSLNVANPANLNNLFRVGGNGLDDFYTPVNMFALSTSLADGLTLSGFYQLEWAPIESPAPGGFEAPIDVGTKNAGPQYATAGFGQLAQDPEGIGILLDNPLSGITNTSSRIQRLRDKDPTAWGQYGISLKYYADWLNNGTDLGLYYAQYHSRLPMVSFISVNRSCMKDATSLVTFLTGCPDLPIAHGITNPNDPAGARSDTVGFSTAKGYIEYPERIKMIGASFNTTIGDLALQGEAAFRPHEPLQVALIDLAFAAFGPTLDNCDKPPGCPLGVGTNMGLGVLPDGSVGSYSGSRYVVDAAGTPGAYNDVIVSGIGDIPGSARSFPSFIIPYRGGVLGANPANSYIRGWEYFKTLSLNFGGTYVEGSTSFTPKIIHADQIIWLFETAAYGVLDLPPLDRLQLEAPGIQYHASAGADGTGADRSRRACSTNQACSFGPDGLRFNPHQQDSKYFPTAWSGGYSIVALIRYESVLPGISLQPQIIFKHDVLGHSPGLASNFIEGRILWDTGIEIRYKSQLSFNVGYRFWAGGGQANLFRDRDEARFYVKYAF